MELTDVLYEKQGKAAWITLNRPQTLNAITSRLTRDLRMAAQEALLDNEVRVLVITGAGRAFSEVAGRNWTAR